MDQQLNSIYTLPNGGQKSIYASMLLNVNFLGAKKLQASDQPSTKDVPQVARSRPNQETRAGRDGEVHGGQVVEEGGDQGDTGQRRPVPAHLGLIPGENAKCKYLSARCKCYTNYRVSIRICAKKTTSFTHFSNTAWRRQWTDRVKITGS